MAERKINLTEIPGYEEFSPLAGAYYGHYAKNVGRLLDERLKGNPLEILTEEGSLTLGVRLEFLPVRTASAEPVLVFFAKTGRIKSVNRPNGSKLELEMKADGAMVKIPLSSEQGEIPGPIMHVPVKIVYNS